jgi:hypothetical protein
MLVLTVRSGGDGDRDNTDYIRFWTSRILHNNSGVGYGQSKLMDLHRISVSGVINILLVQNLCELWISMLIWHVSADGKVGWWRWPGLPSALTCHISMEIQSSQRFWTSRILHNNSGVGYGLLLVQNLCELWISMLIWHVSADGKVGWWRWPGQ